MAIMETEVWDASNPFSVEGNSLALDPDQYDTDIDDIPDPGLLEEKNESSFSEPAPQLFTRSSRWQNMTPRTRARQLWLLLRAGLHDFVEKEKRAELRVARLTHGLEPLRRLEVAAGLRSVAQDPVGRRLVVLDGAGRLHLHREDGWSHGKLLAPVALTGLVTVLGPLGSVGRFVGWGPEGLAILRPDLSLLWRSEPGVGWALGQEPICCLPVPDLGLLLVAEAGGHLALWKFRSGGRCLVPSGSPLQPLPSSVGALTRLALGPLPPHHACCCFAAYGSAVLTFDLHTWAVIDVRRDLHKTTVSDLAYCREVAAMVTASRDSTVKVWAADWQIRMVFVGHTGPVTAMVVLPNTSLALSASQDGTLRTWDLQAAAQVGEVALSCWGHEVQSGHVDCLLAPAGRGWPVLSLRAGSVELWRLRELYSLLAQLSAPVLHLQVAPALPLPLRPPLPARLVCACADGSVYLVSAATGRTVSSLLLEPDDCAAAVAYCLPRELLWLLTRAGDLVCANAARCPMHVLYRSCPPPSPEPRPCCLHLYSHLTDPASAFSTWETVRQHGGELYRSDTQAWKDKNRYLPVLGHTDGTLSVLELCALKTVFRTEAHSPGPVTAIASTLNSIVSSGGDLTVKMWRVFPYAEESLSLLRTFSCCHPAEVLCALGKRVTVAFEDPDSATYGLVQFGLGHSRRCDHRPQDDPMDHVTGLCCCPTLKLYASSSLDCTIRIWTAENRLLRLLQLNGAPQALTFCSNNGDLVLALGSRLCLVPHRLYLPTSYLVKKLCGQVPAVVDDPPLPLTNPESLTSAQQQRLASLHGVASLRGLAALLGHCPSLCPTPLVTPLGVPPAAIPVCSAALSIIHHQTAAPQQPLLEEDLETLVARDHDLQQLRQGLVVPAAQPPLSWHQRKEAFHNYLHLVCSPALLGTHSGTEIRQQGTVTLPTERETETWDVCALPRAAPSLGEAGVCTEVPTVLTTLPPPDPRALGPGKARQPQVSLPIPPTRRGVHSKASQLLARSSLSCYLGLSLDLQLQWEQLHKERPAAPVPPWSHLQRRVSLLLERRPKEPLSNLRGFFPASVQPFKYLQRPIHFPGWIPNSAVLQRMWQPWEVVGSGAYTQLASHPALQPSASQDDLWLRRRRRRHTKWQQQLIRWRGEEESEDEGEALILDWASESLSSQEQLSPELLGSEELATQGFQLSTQRRAGEVDVRTETYLRRFRHRYGRSLWQESYEHLPRFLQFFVVQSWFRKLFPIFTLETYPEMYPEMLTVEGLASLLMGQLEKVSWMDRVHILRALMRLLPDMSKDLCDLLHSLLLRLLNLDPPPGLQDKTQKQFVILALQLLLACSLESRDVVLELMSYFLYSPASYRPELKKLLDGLGLQDPEGFLSKEMMTWLQGPDLDSKSTVRNCCCQKLEDMIRRLQMETSKGMVAKLSDALPKASGTSSLASASKEASSQISMVSVTSSTRTPSLAVPGEPSLVTLEFKVQWPLSQAYIRKARRTLSEALLPFVLLPDIRLRSSAPAVLPDQPLPLEQTHWSQSKMLDLEPIDALNFFCQQYRAQQGSPQEEPVRHSRSPAQELNAVVPQPRDLPHPPILRLQETKMWRWPKDLKGQMVSRLWKGRTLHGSIRTLKLPLPRVDLQPFPPDWPRPARPLPPLLLQPTLQRYFLPDDADPRSSS